ncbi:Glucan endo-1,3-beta-glucosidase 13 [Linum grandiflorum]
MNSSSITQLCMISIPCFFLLLCHFQHYAVGQGLGVTIVRNVKNPPTAAQIVELCVLKGIRRVRVYDGTKDRDIIKAISDTFAGLQVLVGVGKDDVYRIASDLKAIEAQKWLNANVVPFDQYVNFLCILVGNDHMVQQGNREMWAVYWALAHLKMAQRKLGLNIFLGIAMDTGILTESFPPSAAEFIPSIMPVFRPLLNYTARNMGCVVITLFPQIRYSWRKCE